MINKFLTLILSAFALLAAAQPRSDIERNTASATEDAVMHEITKTDITTLEKVSSAQLSLYGLYLGLKINEALEICKKQRSIKLHQDKFNNNRFYLQKYVSYSREPVYIAYLKWTHEDSGMQEIIIYPECKPYLAGDSKELLTAEVLNFRSKLVKEFLGYPKRKQVVLMAPSINLKHTAYYYPEKGFQVVKKVKGSNVSFDFGFYTEEGLFELDEAMLSDP